MKLRDSLRQKLQLDVNTYVLVCQPSRPLVQVDMLVSERLELWRLPADTSIVSDRYSSLRVFKHDDADKKHSRLFVREVVEVAARDSKNALEATQDALSMQLDLACGAINVTMRRFDKIRRHEKSAADSRRTIYVSNHILLYVTFPKLAQDFTWVSRTLKCSA